MARVVAMPLDGGLLHARALQPAVQGPPKGRVAVDLTAMFELFHNPNFDFIGRRRWAYIIPLIFILSVCGHIVAKGGLRYGINFSGSTLIQARYDKPVPVDRIRRALESARMQA